MKKTSEHCLSLAFCDVEDWSLAFLVLDVQIVCSKSPNCILGPKYVVFYVLILVSLCIYLYREKQSINPIHDAREWSQDLNACKLLLLLLCHLWAHK